MDKGQKSLYATHVNLVMNICTKYEEDSSSERKL